MNLADSALESLLWDGSNGEDFRDHVLSAWQT